MRFDLADLRLFVNVVEAGSITGGAERLNLALAAASTRIRNMEAVLGTPLLHRQRQGVVPTQAGHTRVQHARILLRQAERMHGDLRQYAEGIRGQLRLLSNTNTLTEFLAEPLSAFLAAIRASTSISKSGSAVRSRFVECDVGVGIVPAITALHRSRTMAIRRVELADAWAVRKLRICPRRTAELPIYARQLVQHLAAPPPG